MLERIFKLSKNQTSVKTEVMAGITTFMTMAYILAVNPSILADAGMDQGLTAIIHSLKLCLLILYLISTKLTIGLDFSINPAVFRPLPPACPVRKKGDFTDTTCKKTTFVRKSGRITDKHIR